MFLNPALWDHRPVLDVLRWHTLLPNDAFMCRGSGLWATIRLDNRLCRLRSTEPLYKPIPNCHHYDPIRLCQKELSKLKNVSYKNMLLNRPHLACFKLICVVSSVWIQLNVWSISTELWLNLIFSPNMICNLHAMLQVSMHYFYLRSILIDSFTTSCIIAESIFRRSMLLKSDNHCAITCHVFIPSPNEVGGGMGMLDSPCPSVYPSIRL